MESWYWWAGLNAWIVNNTSFWTSVKIRTRASEFFDYVTATAELNKILVKWTWRVTKDNDWTERWICESNLTIVKIIR